jgi:hypothetical protein
MLLLNNHIVLSIEDPFIFCSKQVKKKLSIRYPNSKEDLQMKKFIGLFIITGFFLFNVITAFAQVESLTQINVGSVNTTGVPVSIGSIRTTAVYRATGTAENTLFTSQQKGSIFGQGVLGVNLYNNQAGAITGQEEIILKNGYVSTLTKVGLDTLVTTVREADPKITDGVFTQTAAGFSFFGLAKTPGTGATVLAAYTTGPAIVAQYGASGVLDNFNVKSGAVLSETTGYGPTDPTSDGPRVSNITQYSEQHWAATSYNFGTSSPTSLIFNSTISFNKLISVIPKP